MKTLNLDHTGFCLSLLNFLKLHMKKFYYNLNISACKTHSHSHLVFFFFPLSIWSKSMVVSRDAIYIKPDNWYLITCYTSQLQVNEMLAEYFFLFKSLRWPQEARHNQWNPYFKLIFGKTCFAENYNFDTNRIICFWF